MVRQEVLDQLKRYSDELRTIQVLRQQEINKGYLTIIERQCLLNNGKIITRDQIIKGGKEGSAVVVLPILDNNSTILVVQPRVFKKSTIGIELPSGYIEEGENSKHAAIREYEEETGYQPRLLIPLRNYYQDSGCSSAYNHSYMAIGYKGKGSQHLDHDEFIRIVICKYREALDLADMGIIDDANSLLTLDKSKQFIKRRGLYA